MQEKGKLSKEFNEKVQSGYPGNHGVTGETYKKLEAQEKPNPEKLDKLKAVTKAYDTKLDKKAQSMANRQGPELNHNPPGTGNKSNKKESYKDFKARLDKETKEKAEKIRMKGKAKEDFNKSM